jgi:PAP2 superfamily protein
MLSRDRPAGDMVLQAPSSRPCPLGWSRIVREWGARTIQPSTTTTDPRQVAETQTDVETSHRWLVGVWVLVAAFALLTLIGSLRIGIPIRDPHGGVFRFRVAISLGLFIALVLLDGAVRAGADWKSRTVLLIRRRWTARRLTLALTGLLAYHVVYFCYHNLKSWDVFNRPRDAMLLEWDRWLFFGHDPAVLLHDLLGQHVAAYVLMVIYESFSTLVSVAFVAAMVVPDRMRDGYVFITSMLWIWILGVGSYYLIPSLGPFDSAPKQFDGLPHMMIQDTQARYMAQRAHLLAHPQAADAFAQVSAFASLHVGVTAVLLLMARYYGLRRVSAALTVFLVGTIIATVYLGWHFAVDDVAGLAIAYLSVRFGRWMTYPRGEPRRPSERGPGRRPRAGRLALEGQS